MTKKRDMMKKIKIFISYSHENSEWLDDNYSYSLLKFWKRALGEDVIFWFDKDETVGIKGGDKWREKIFTNIDDADIAILLITADFVVSPFIFQHELPYIMEKLTANKLEILPILVEPARWEKLNVHGMFQMIPGKPTPISEYIDKGMHTWKQVRLEIVDALENLIDKVKQRKNPPDLSEVRVIEPEVVEIIPTKDEDLVQEKLLPKVNVKNLQVQVAKSNPCGQILFSSNYRQYVVMSHGFGWKGLLGVWDSENLEFVNPMYFAGLNKSSVPFFQVGFRNQQVYYVSGWNSNEVSLHHIDYSVDRNNFLAVSQSGLFYFDPKKGALATKPIRDLREVVLSLKTKNYIRSLALSSNVQYIAACFDGKSIIYSCDSAKEVTTIEEDAPSRTFQDYYASFSPNSRYFAFITPKQNIHYTGPTSMVVIDTTTWTEKNRYADPEYKYQINSFAFSYDEKYLAAADSKPQILVWNMISNSVKCRLQRPDKFEKRSYQAITISADNKYLIASAGWLEFWDLELEELIFVVDKYANDFVIRPDMGGQFYASEGAKEHVSIRVDLRKYTLQVYENTFPMKLESLGIKIKKEDLFRKFTS